MHVALYSPAWPLEKYHNGIVTYVHWMRLELEAMGHQVSVFTGTGGAPDDPRVHLVRQGWSGRFIEGLRRRRLGERVGQGVFEWGRVLAASIRAVHRREPIDIIEMEESFGWSGDVARLTRIPLLVKLHGPAFLSLIEDELHTPVGVERIRREGTALSDALAIAAPAESTLAATIGRYGLQPVVRKHVVNPLAAMSAAPRWRLEGCELNALLFVGRFDRRKGADTVLHAFALLLREGRKLVLRIVGPDVGLLQPNGSRVHLKEFLDVNFTADEAERVHYLGVLPNHEIGALRSAAMVTVVASRWENQGYTALEAMVQGCPVVATAVGGNPESILHERTGLLANPEDPADLARQIASMLDRPSAAATMGAAAHEHALLNHSPSKVANDTLGLYRRVIESWRPER